MLSERAQAAVGRIGREGQAQFGARGEHPVGLENPGRRQVVHHHAEVRLQPVRDPGRAPQGGQRRICARDQPEAGRLLVASGAADLSREVEAGYRPHAERWQQLGGRSEVVFDGVPPARDFRPLQPVDRRHELGLDLGRKARRKAVHVDPGVIDPHRLEVQEVPLAVSEAHDLVLERRAVPGTPRPDPPGVERGAVEARPDERVDPLVGVGQPGRELRQLGAERLVREVHEGERDRALVARLLLEAGGIEGAPPQARRGPGLEALQPDPQRLQGDGKGVGGGFSGPSPRGDRFALEQQSPQERAGRQDHRGSGKVPPVGRFDRRDPPALRAQPGCFSGPKLDPALGLDHPLDDGRVAVVILLGPGSLHGGAAAPVEQTEVGPGRVRGEPHDPAQRVDLPHQVSLADPADRRVAGKPHQGRRVERQEDHLDPQAGSCRRRFDAGVATTDHHHGVSGPHEGSSPGARSYGLRPARRREGEMFHVEHPAARRTHPRQCSTWNILIESAKSIFYNRLQGAQ